MATPTTMFAMKATIKSVYPVQQVTDKFRKCNVVVADQFNNDVMFEALYELADNMASFAPGTQVDITFHLSSNPMKIDPSRWFTSAAIDSIQPSAAAAAPPAATPAPVAAPTPVAAAPAPAAAAAAPPF